MDRYQFASESTLDGSLLSGVAHAFGQLTLRGGHYEAFRAGAFDDALSRSDVRAFMEHDRGKLIGRQKSGTLRLSSTKVGLEFEIDLPDTSYANDLRALVARGDINEMSFGMIPGEFEYGSAPDGTRVRWHTKVRELVDVSPVALPAFTGTNVQLHSDGFTGDSIQSQLVRIRAHIRSGT